MSAAPQLSAPSVVPTSFADRAYEGIRDRLVMLDIRPGEPLNDAALAQELGTGRTPVREALKRLESDRLVVAYPRRGTFATAVDITDLAHISEIRAELEPLAAARAARTASEAGRAHLAGLVEEVAGLEARISDRREILRRDVHIHREIYRAAGNPHLEDILVRQDTGGSTSHSSRPSSRAMPRRPPDWRWTTWSASNAPCARCSDEHPGRWRRLPELSCPRGRSSRAWC
jgi:DNA-binding GntR family transcriptional regulator